VASVRRTAASVRLAIRTGRLLLLLLRRPVVSADGLACLMRRLFPDTDASAVRLESAPSADLEASEAPGGQVV
jgi:hypothetical protein